MGPGEPAGFSVLLMLAEILVMELQLSRLPTLVPMLCMLLCPPSVFPNTAPTAVMRYTPSCSMAVPIPNGWVFDGDFTLAFSPNAVRIQGHFWSGGAEIIFKPLSIGGGASGADELLSDVARFAVQGRATLQVFEYSTRFPHHQRAQVQFDEAAPYQGIRSVERLEWACNVPVLARLRYYPRSGKEAHWNRIFRDVLMKMRQFK